MSVCSLHHGSCHCHYYQKGTPALRGTSELWVKPQEKGRIGSEMFSFEPGVWGRESLVLVGPLTPMLRKNLSPEAGAEAGGQKGQGPSMRGQAPRPDIRAILFLCIARDRLRMAFA